MITEVRARNAFSFAEPIILSAKADMRTKKFSSNLLNYDNINIVKSLGIFGPNNVGKTCLIQCIKCIKNILLNKHFSLHPNLFTKSPVCELGISFIYKNHEYSYDVVYSAETKEFLSEKFSETNFDLYKNKKNNIIFYRDSQKDEYSFDDETISNAMQMISRNNILIHLIDSEKSEKLKEYKDILMSFADKIDIINMNNIPLQKTIELLKDKNNLQDKIVAFIKQADLDLDDFKLVPAEELAFEVEQNGTATAEEDVLNIPNKIIDQLRLTSVHKGIDVPSIIFDSTGTKKIVALSSYIIEALENGRIIVIDELDSSLHFKLTRAIITMFNNELNNNAQIIFTAHDTNLIDCKKLFRKDQIWFIHKDREGVYVYSLLEFTAQDGIRDTTDINDKYCKGIFGALPEPEFIDTLISIHHKNGGAINDT